MNEYEGHWIATYTGKKFHYLTPPLDEICIEDIAHALSLTCRFGGHCTEFYCPTPNEKILMANLEWKSAGDIKEGESLLSFDEYPIEIGSCGKKRRRMRPSSVLHISINKAPVYRLILRNGENLQSSGEHPWLAATKQSGNQKWVTTIQLKKDIEEGHKRYLHKFVNTWREADSKSSGWLSGIADGEGYFSCQNRGGMQLGISQRDGLILDRIKQELSNLGFDYSVLPTGDSDCKTVQLRDGWRGILRFLGEVRPIRLLDNFTRVLAAGDFTKQFDGINKPIEIIAIENMGVSEIIPIETSTHTYICEGYAAHNSVAEHSVRVASIVDPKDQMAALLHDAHEAYLHDVPRPIKHDIRGYQEIADKIQLSIHRAFNVWVYYPDHLKFADDVLLATEARDIMATTQDWADLPVPLPMAIRPWGIKMAELEFLHLFNQLRDLQLWR